MLMRWISSRLTVSILVMSMLFCQGIFTPVHNVDASTELTAPGTYDRNAAVKWAQKNNHDDGRFWGDSEHGRYCTTYVTKAMQAGGIAVPTYTGNVQLANWLQSHPDYWEIRPKNQLELGDIIFLNNKAQIPDNLEISWIDHVVMVTGAGKYSAWNAERVNKNFSKLAKWNYEKGVHLKIGSIIPTTIPTAIPTAIPTVVPTNIPGNFFTQFLGNPTSTLKDKNGKANLSICADNLAGSTIYVLFRWPSGLKKDGSVKWTKLSYSQMALSNCITFVNIDGPGVLIKGVVYESRAALNQQPQANWPASDCYTQSDYQGLCNIVRKNNK
jgi:hypothetical protein